MSNVIYGNVVGGTGGGVGKTLKLIDENGVEIIGTIVDSIKEFTARPKDIRIGKVAVTDNGVVTGENTITYRTTTGVSVIQPSSMFSIPLSEHNKYDYTKIQCIISPFNTSVSDSVIVEKTVINDDVYSNVSATPIAVLSKNSTTKSIDLNIQNDSNKVYIIRYFTYKQED